MALDPFLPELSLRLFQVVEVVAVELAAALHFPEDHERALGVDDSRDVELRILGEDHSGEHALRDCVKKSHMTEEKQRALLDKLDAFENELEKKRLSLMVATLLAFEVISIPGSLWATGEVAHKLITTVMQIVAEDKAKEDEIRQLPATQIPKALLPPRAEKKPTRKAPDLDDEIPF